MSGVARAAHKAVDLALSNKQGAEIKRTQKPLRPASVEPGTQKPNG
jgi:hypothetical protein